MLRRREPAKLDRELSRAVVVYIGYGSEITPRRDLTRLRAEFGEKRAAELEGRVSDLIREILAFEVDWSRESLDGGTRLAGREMRARHPELSDEAIEALEWEFAWDWR